MPRRAREGSICLMKPVPHTRRVALGRLWLCLLLTVLVPAAQADSPPVVRLEMREFSFQPSTVRLPAGRLVKLVLMNRGQLAHQVEAAALRGVPATVIGGPLHVESTGLDVVRVQPGGSATVETLLPKRGRFPFACTIEGHREAGMTGMLDIR